MKSEDDEIDKLLNGVLNSYKSNKFDTLRQVFTQRIEELKLSQAQVEKSLRIERRTLNGILDGTTKKFDLVNLIKIAKFLDLKVNDLVQRYVNEALYSSKANDPEIEKKNFIFSNFDLASLKKLKLINSISDFKHIEEKICDFFGFTTIYDYKRNRVNPAFSTVKKSDNNRVRDLWIETAYHNLKRINNFYPFDRNELIGIFPGIRVYSTNVEKGLYSVMRMLFKVGITVIYQPYESALRIRGATFTVNDKPCIVLTNFRKNYPTIWFALLHELHHVLFDLEEIKVNTYHLSGEDDLFLSREEKANDFARDYLFSLNKLNEVTPFIGDEAFIYEYADRFQVHPSIIYDFYCYAINKNEGKNTWNRFKRHYPDINLCLKKIDVNPWQKPIRETVKIIHEQIFNNL